MVIHYSTFVGIAERTALRQLPLSAGLVAALPSRGWTSAQISMGDGVRAGVGKFAGQD